MSDKGLVVDNKQHELHLGASFNKHSKVGYHSIRYDFKPASVDTSKEAQLDVGEKHHVTLTVPHVEGSGKTHTVYKGNKRPVSKECVLIIDHDTGTFTLERLTNNINVKKTRADTSHITPLANRPVTPVETKVKNSPEKLPSSQSPYTTTQSPYTTTHRQSQPISSPAPAAASMPKLEHGTSVLGEISDSDSDSDDGSSDSDSDTGNPITEINQVSAPISMPMSLIPPPLPAPPRENKPQNFMNIINADLQLSDTDSDSD